MSAISTKEFKKIAAIARERWGLDLPEKKLASVSSRLLSFVRKSGRFTAVADYLDHLHQDADEEDMVVFFDILSTNVTSFFRDRAHFDYLERELFTPLARGNLTLPGRKLRLWSAGCSAGPEPYSMAITILETMTDLQGWDCQILATDLSNKALEKARRAVYPAEQVGEMDPALVRRHFKKGTGPNEGLVQVGEQARKLVTIRRLNLMEPWPFKGPFNVIFCRNVMIYFDRDTRERLVNRYYELLAPGGIFAVGSSETLSGLDTPFKSVQASIYAK